MKRANFIQIGNTCGFYSLVYCINSLIPLDHPEKILAEIVQNSIDSDESYVGEAFDIEYLVRIAEKYFSDIVHVSVCQINSEADIFTYLCGARLLFPINSKSVPHYVSLLGLENGKILACNGGKLCSFSSKWLYKKNKETPTFYNWRKFRTYSKLDFLIARRLFKLSLDEYEQFIADNARNRNMRKVLHKLGKAPTNMRGLCIQIKAL